MCKQCGGKCGTIKHGCYLGSYKVPMPAPYILHTGERVLNRRQTVALANAEKQGIIKLPPGATKPQRLSKTEVRKMLTHYVNGTTRGPQKNKKKAKAKSNVKGKKGNKSGDKNK